MNKAEFVTRLGYLLRDAKPSLVSCKLATGSDIVREHKVEGHWAHLHPQIQPSEYDEWVVVACANGYEYKATIDK